MNKPICSLDELIDKVDMPEIDRETAKVQVHRVEALVDGIEYCTGAVGRLIRLLRHLPAIGTRQH